MCSVDSVQVNCCVSVVRDKIPIPLPFWVFPTSSSFSPTKYHCLAFSRPLRERIRLCRRESPLLGLLRVLSSASSSPQVTRRLYILPRVLPILIFDHSLLNILSVNFLSIFASTCYIITFCSKHVDISFCILSTHFLSDKENIFMNFNQYILSFTVNVVWKYLTTELHKKIPNVAV